MVNGGHFAIYVRFMCFGSLAGVTYLHYTDYTVLASPKKSETSTVAILLYQFLSSWCLEMFFT